MNKSYGSVCTVTNTGNDVSIDTTLIIYIVINIQRWAPKTAVLLYTEVGTINTKQQSFHIQRWAQ